MPLAPPIVARIKVTIRKRIGAGTEEVRDFSRAGGVVGEFVSSQKR
jgi:hypothetical protein